MATRGSLQLQQILFWTCGYRLDDVVPKRVLELSPLPINYPAKHKYAEPLAECDFSLGRVLTIRAVLSGLSVLPFRWFVRGRHG